MQPQHIQGVMHASAPEPEPSRDRTGLRIAMALYADVTFDSRVIREAATLAGDGHSVTVYCLAGSAIGDVPFDVVAATPPGASVLPDGSSPFLQASGASPVGRVVVRIRWVTGYARTVRAWGRMIVGMAGDVDVWHVHDLTGLLAVAPFAPSSARVIYDSHEIFIETGTAARLPGSARRLLKWYERRLAARASTLITVNEGYARVLERRLRPRETVVVRNCPPRWSPPAEGSTRLRDAAGIPMAATIVLYHGAFSRHRGIEELASALLEPGLEAVHGVLLGFGPLRDGLVDLARDPSFGGRLHVLDAVPPANLLEWVSGADVDVMALQRSTLNHWLCTPNKLWESLAAGVPVVVSDFPGMRQIVCADPVDPLGATCDPVRPSSIAAAILAVAGRPEPGRAALRERCRTAATERWNWETEGAVLLDAYRRLMSSPTVRREPEGPGAATDR